jgi:hypothetical protein
MMYEYYSCVDHNIYSHYIPKIGKLITSLLICVFLFCACQEVDEDLAFELVRRYYPDCQKTKPNVVHVEKVKMVNGTETKGLYLPKLNMILLSEDADLDVLVHEYRHACGDLLGEKIILSELNVK